MNRGVGSTGSADREVKERGALRAQLGLGRIERGER